MQYLLHYIYFFIFLFLSEYIGNDLDIEMSVLLLYHKYFLIIMSTKLQKGYMDLKMSSSPFNVNQIGLKFWVNYSFNSTTLSFISGWAHHRECTVYIQQFPSSWKLLGVEFVAASTLTGHFLNFQNLCPKEQKRTPIFVIITWGSWWFDWRLWWGAVQWPGRQFNGRSLLSEATSH